VSPHKDNAFLMTTPLSTHGLWCAIDDATLDNGCMWAVPGSHLEPPTHYFRAEAGRAGARWDAGRDPQQYAEESRARGVPLEARSGTLVVLHGNLVHYSAANTSDRGRAAFTMHVVEGALPWSPDNWLAREAFVPWPKHASAKH
jgi:phytanoyl-CoA hydroxylase